MVRDVRVILGGGGGRGCGQRHLALGFNRWRCGGGMSVLIRDTSIIWKRVLWLIPPWKMPRRRSPEAETKEDGGSDGRGHCHISIFITFPSSSRPSIPINYLADRSINIHNPP